jgi:hypothetical protein
MYFVAPQIPFIAQGFSTTHFQKNNAEWEKMHKTRIPKGNCILTAGAVWGYMEPLPVQEVVL